MVGDRSAAGTCPVCKSAISRDKCIPIYTRGREQIDPRQRSSSSSNTNNPTNEGEIPQRPAGQREEPAPRSSRFAFSSLFGGRGSSGFTFQRNTGFGSGNWRFNDRRRQPGVQFNTGFGFPFFGLQLVHYILITNTYLLTFARRIIQLQKKWTSKRKPFIKSLQGYSLSLVSLS